MPSSPALIAWARWVPAGRAIVQPARTGNSSISPSGARARVELQRAAALEDDEDLLLGRMHVRRVHQLPGWHDVVGEPRALGAGGVTEVARHVSDGCAWSRSAAGTSATLTMRDGRSASASQVGAPTAASRCPRVVLRCALQHPGRARATRRRPAAAACSRRSAVDRTRARRAPRPRPRSCERARARGGRDSPPARPRTPPPRRRPTAPRRRCRRGRRRSPPPSPRDGAEWPIDPRRSRCAAPRTVIELSTRQRLPRCRDMPAFAPVGSRPRPSA